MPSVRIEFEIPDEANFSSLRVRYNGSWSVCLCVSYDVRTEWGSSLGGSHFCAEGATVEDAAFAAANRLLAYIATEQAKPKPKPICLGLVKPKSQLDLDLEGLLKSASFKLKGR